jgi:hypothetical protein
MFIIANAGLFAFLITRAGVPGAIGQWLQGLPVARVFPAGRERGPVHHSACSSRPAQAIIVLAPILVPVAVRFGMDPGALRHRGGRGPGAGHGRAPCGVEPVRPGLHGGQDARCDRIVQGRRCPSSVWCSGCLMVISYVPQLSLALRDLVYAR